MKKSGNYLFGRAFNAGNFWRIDMRDNSYKVINSYWGSPYIQLKGNKAFVINYSENSNKNGYIMTFNIEDSRLGDGHTPDTLRLDKLAKEFENMVDPDNLDFRIYDDYVYYNAIKNGRETWLARKKADGTGAVEWICKGAVENHG